MSRIGEHMFGRYPIFLVYIPKTTSANTKSLTDRPRPLQRAPALLRTRLLERCSHSARHAESGLRMPESAEATSADLARPPPAPWHKDEGPLQQQGSAWVGQIRLLSIATLPVTAMFVGHERGVQMRRDAELSFARRAHMRQETVLLRRLELVRPPSENVGAPHRALPRRTHASPRVPSRLPASREAIPNLLLGARHARQQGDTTATARSARARPAAEDGETLLPPWGHPPHESREHPRRPTSSR